MKGTIKLSYKTIQINYKFRQKKGKRKEKERKGGPRNRPIIAFLHVHIMQILHVHIMQMEEKESPCNHLETN